jgi:acetyl-CoA carboxylase carboxyl transferase subunit beta
VIAAENAWLSPLPPEGASVIVYGDLTHAAAMATAQHVRAADLLAQGTAQRIVPERADDKPEDLALAVAAEIRHQLDKQNLTGAASAQSA